MKLLEEPDVPAIEAAKKEPDEPAKTVAKNEPQAEQAVVAPAQLAVKEVEVEQAVLAPKQLAVKKEEGYGVMLGAVGAVGAVIAGGVAAAYLYAPKPADDRKRRGR